MIHYIKGDATVPQATGKKIIAHICNDRGGWGKGFVLAISKRWQQPEQEYRRWYTGKLDRPFGLGMILIVQVTPHMWVANMIGQHGMKEVADRLFAMTLLSRAWSNWHLKRRALMRPFTCRGLVAAWLVVNGIVLNQSSRRRYVRLELASSSMTLNRAAPKVLRLI